MLKCSYLLVKGMENDFLALIKNYFVQDKNNFVQGEGQGLDNFLFLKSKNHFPCNSQAILQDSLTRFSGSLCTACFCQILQHFENTHTHPRKSIGPFASL